MIHLVYAPAYLTVSVCLKSVTSISDKLQCNYLLYQNTKHRSTDSQADKWKKENKKRTGTHHCAYNL